MVDTPVMDGSITSVSFTQVVADLSSVIASAAGNAQDIETNHQDINSLLGFANFAAALLTVFAAQTSRLWRVLSKT